MTSKGERKQRAQNTAHIDHPSPYLREAEASLSPRCAAGRRRQASSWWRL